MGRKFLGHQVASPHEATTCGKPPGEDPRKIPESPHAEDLRGSHKLVTVPGEESISLLLKVNKMSGECNGNALRAKRGGMH